MILPIERVWRLTAHRYNTIWTRDVQNVIFSILLCGWLGGMATASKPAEVGRLFTIEEVGEILNSDSALYNTIYPKLIDFQYPST